MASNFDGSRTDSALLERKDAKTDAPASRRALFSGLRGTIATIGNCCRYFCQKWIVRTEFLQTPWLVITKWLGQTVDEATSEVNDGHRRSGFGEPEDFKAASRRERALKLLVTGDG